MTKALHFDSNLKQWCVKIYSMLIKLLFVYDRISYVSANRPPGSVLSPLPSCCAGPSDVDIHQLTAQYTGGLPTCPPHRAQGCCGDWTGAEHPLLGWLEKCLACNQNAPLAHGGATTTDNNVSLHFTLRGLSFVTISDQKVWNMPL